MINTQAELKRRFIKDNMFESENHIIVVDSPMASGKTTWAINHINELDEDQKVKC